MKNIRLIKNFCQQLLNIERKKRMFNCQSHIRNNGIITTITVAIKPVATRSHHHPRPLKYLTMDFQFNHT